MEKSNDTPNFEEINSGFKCSNPSSSNNFYNKEEEYNKQSCNTSIFSLQNELKGLNINATPSLIKETNSFLGKKKERKNDSKIEGEDEYLKKIQKLECNMRKLSLNVINKGEGNSKSVKEYKDIMGNEALNIFLDKIKLNLENFGVIKLKNIDLNKVFRKKEKESILNLTIKELFCFNKENKAIIEDAIPDNEDLFNFFLSTTLENLFCNYFINCRSFTIKGKKEIIEVFKTLNDTIQEKENKYILYDDVDYQDEKIEEFIYSSFLVFNKFNPCNFENPENSSTEFGECSYPIWVRKKLCYFMNLPSNYLKGLCRDCKKRKDPISKAKDESLKFLLKLNQIIAHFENSSEMENDNIQKKEIKNFNFIGNNF